jgi:nicotinamide-nucleotide amidase
MTSAEMFEAASEVLGLCSRHRFRVVTAESCTGGMIAAAFTATSGSSLVFERGYVTYSNNAKIEDIGVPAELIEEHGAVSEQVAHAMAFGAIKKAKADIGLSVTGIAGPTGGTPQKPVGLVHITAAHRDGKLLHRECRFGPIGRGEVRRLSAMATLALAKELLLQF